ncbi:MAG: ATP-dependent sacrificial sulfur transferase LarE, partial [Burkholderiales bacterium]|nr:ATP-dependent sacrificial sulfur transferase LarE [Burkholderiales bacterium]
MSEEKLEKLNQILLKAAPHGRLAIAFSGGIDSRFLSYTAKRFGFKPHLYHFTGPHLAPGETEEAINWAKEHEFEITVLPINPLEVHEVSYNQKDRCYYCKKVLFSKLAELADAPICDGTNHSDLGAYRPGIRALEELNIHSPLALAGITKSEIRRLSKETGLDRPEQPSKPCMLTRFPYQYHLDPQLLTLAGNLEKSLSKFFQDLLTWLPAFRIRQTANHRFELHIEKD